MEKFLRQNGMYVLLLAGMVGIQLVLAYGGYQEQMSPVSGSAPMQKIASQAMDATLPVGLFLVSAGLVFVFGAGLVVDAIFFMQWLLARSAGRLLLESRLAGSNPWETEDVFRLFVLFFFAMTCIDGLIALLPLEFLSHFLGNVGLYAVVIITLIVWMRAKNVSPIAIARAWWGRARGDAAKGLVAYVGFVPLLAILLFVSLALCQAMGIEAEPHDLVNILREEHDPLRIATLVFLTIGVGPVMEEILFRWVTYGAMRKRVGILGSASGSAMLFAVAHANVAQTLPIFGMGIVLALLYETTGSLVASISFHMLNNTLALILTMAMIHGMPGS